MMIVAAENPDSFGQRVFDLFVARQAYSGTEPETFDGFRLGGAEVRQTLLLNQARRFVRDRRAAVVGSMSVVAAQKMSSTTW